MHRQRQPMSPPKQRVSLRVLTRARHRVAREVVTWW
jgi:hypothetical protein